ncbi:hypothetical protein Q3H58_003056 [Pseudomonas psychrotolerans]|uniref:Uncharacterized protein n=1 Tax=Pseudomonas oryzihabitans TaxID=47885 RepID=A0AAJ2BHR7_9PSED|nr:hypothetical protein [Pseudomonas psychrotolerans]MDR6356385.1 hypothetical protein [Pseudomonas psychrotolerans]
MRPGHFAARARLRGLVRAPARVTGHLFDDIPQYPLTTTQGWRKVDLLGFLQDPPP